jgi:hypothetical protein
MLKMLKTIGFGRALACASSGAALAVGALAAIAVLIGLVAGAMYVVTPLIKMFPLLDVILLWIYYTIAACVGVLFLVLAAVWCAGIYRNRQHIVQSLQQLPQQAEALPGKVTSIVGNGVRVEWAILALTQLGIYLGIFILDGRAAAIYNDTPISQINQLSLLLLASLVKMAWEMLLLQASVSVIFCFFWGLVADCVVNMLKPKQRHLPLIFIASNMVLVSMLLTSPIFGAVVGLILMAAVVAIKVPCNETLWDILGRRFRKESDG